MIKWLLEQQIHSPRLVLMKSCSENIQQICRRTPCGSVISIKLLGLFLYPLKASENQGFQMFPGGIETNQATLLKSYFYIGVLL